MTPNAVHDIPSFSDQTPLWKWTRSIDSPCRSDPAYKEHGVLPSFNNLYQTHLVQPLVHTSFHAGTKRPPGRVRPNDSDVEIGRCTKLCEDGQVAAAVEALDLLVQRGCMLPSDLLYRLLRRCIVQKDLVTGRRLQALSVTSGYESNAFLANHLICMYASHGCLVEAMQVFSRVSAPDAYMWASIILAFAKHGQPTQAIGLYRQMCDLSTVKPDKCIFVAVLKACASARDLAVGKEVHAQICASAARPDIVVETCLVDMYAKCGSLEDAKILFDRLPRKDVVTWTVMIACYVQHGMGQQALSLYGCMQQEATTPPDSVIFVCLLQACASVGVGALLQGKQIHMQLQDRGLQHAVVVGSSLVNMYAKCGSVEHARRVFDRLPHKNVVTWTAMIASYAQQGMGQDALTLYASMRQSDLTPPDSVTFVCLLQACACVGATALEQGKQLHFEIEERGLADDVVVGNSIVNMYAKCRSLEDAHRVFDRLSQKTVVTWNSMIAGYAQQGRGLEALDLYSSMLQKGSIPPDSVTYVCLLQACATVAALPLGKQLHAQIEELGLQTDGVVGPSLVNMYAKCGSLEDAQQVFESLPERQIGAWDVLIAGYARHGDSQAVFDLLHRLRREGLHPSARTLLSVLAVCSHVGLVDEGQKYFGAMATEYCITPTVEHYMCMTDLLGRAGHINEALRMVKSMPFQPDVTVWVMMLGACTKWRNVDVGQQAFECAVRIDEKDATAYVLMSNLYAGVEMWEEAKEMQARRLKFGAWKQQGQSWWTDMAGVVHRFEVGDRKHPETQAIYARLKLLVLKMKKAGYLPNLESSLRDTGDDEKEAELCGHSEKLAIAYALNKTPDGTTIRIVKNLRACIDCHTATSYISKVEKRTIICRDSSRFHVYMDGKCSCGDYW